MSAPVPRSPTPDLAAAARSVARVVERQGGRVGAEPTLPEASVKALLDARLFDLVLPRELGGFEADPVTQIEVFETIAHADGSAGWCLMACAANAAFAGAYTDEAAARQMFGGRGPVVYAGQLAPRGEARRAEGGYRVQGRWSFGSGLAHCQWVLGGCRVQREGASAPPAGALPEMLVVCVPLEKVQLRGNWNVMGLQETGSFDYEISDALVPEGFTFSPFATEPRRGGPLFRMGVFAIAAAGHAGFALGVGRRALDEIARLARTRQRLGEGPLVDQPTFQRTYARVEARLRAARCLASDALDRLYRHVCAGDAPTQPERALVRMAATHATDVAVDAASFAYRMGGSDALRIPSVIQRCFRDVHAGAQHIFVGDTTWLETGQVLLGTAPPHLLL